MAIGKKRVGGALIFGSALFIGRESIAWLWGRFLDLASSGADEVSLAAFPWQSTLVFLTALVGGYLAFWPDKKQPVPSAAQRAQGLGIRAASIVARFNLHRGIYSRVAEHSDPFGGIFQDGISLLLSFEKEGFQVPNMSPLNERERWAVCMLDYFERISPLLRDGHIEEATFVSKQFADDAIEQARETHLGYFR